ncbi:MAG: hypothetical protein GYA33_00685 [Thermogutta sp.]|nr:hypothetical protein [Thermogutta sp.]
MSRYLGTGFDVVGRLWVILGAWSCVLLAASGAAAAEGATGNAALHVQTGDEVCSITWNGKTLMRYRKAVGVPKAYVAELAPPSGRNILRDSPVDHKHHHGLMFALGVDGVVYWEEFAGSGRQVEAGDFQASAAADADAATASLTHTLNWVTSEGKPQLIERRRLRLRYSPQVPQAVLLLWRSELSPADGTESVRLWGRDYFGLGIRFLAAMDGGNDFRNAAGGRGVEGTNKASAEWCAYTAELDGKPVTTVLYDMPGNPRAPAKWFTMTQGFTYISATLGLAEEPLTLTAEQAPLLLQYGVVVFDGAASDAEIQAAYEELKKMAKETP